MVFLEKKRTKKNENSNENNNNNNDNNKNNNNNNNRKKHMITMKPVLCILLLMVDGCWSQNAVEANTTSAYTFQERGVQSDSYVMYNDDLSKFMPLTAISLCFRLRFFYVWELSGLMLLQDTLNPAEIRETMHVEISNDYIRLAMGSLRRYHKFPRPLLFLEWYHICLTYEEEGVMKAYLNGQEYSRSMGKIYKPLTGSFLKLGSWNRLKSFSGEVTQLNIWSRALTDDFIANVSGCTKKEGEFEGDILRWSGPWGQMQGDVTQYFLPKENPCQNTKSNSYHFFPTITAPASFKLCESLGGHLSVPTTKENIISINDFIEKFNRSHEDLCYRIWIGYTDEKEEDRWIHYKTGQEIIPNWRADAPDGGNLQNCAYFSRRIDALYKDRPVLSDIFCNKLLCLVCQVPRAAPWKIRGSCQQNEKHSRYLLTQDTPEQISFRGYSSYDIIKDNSSDAWLWRDRQRNLTIARLEKRDLLYPMGRHSWRLERSVCQADAGEDLILLLTSCGEGSFSCDDATCIPLFQRCDLKFDCGDRSDEDGCQLVNLPLLYRSDIPPSVKSSDRQEGGIGEASSPLPVTVLMLIDSLGVDSSNMLLLTGFNLSMTWNEGRVKYSNLNEDRTLNRVTDAMKQSLWSPKIDFANTQGNFYTQVDSEAEMIVSLQGRPAFGTDEYPEEVEFYSGNENSLTVRRKYSLVFQCQFSLVMYPFDEQECYMELRMLSASSRLLIFNESATDAVFEGERDLVEYTVGRVSVAFDNEADFASFRVEISLTRRSGFILLNVYIPSMLLLMICYMTLYFKPSIFQVRIIGSLTTLLVMVTLFTQASSSLPKTSYFKLVDVWLLCCIVLIFFVIICHVIIDHFQKPEKDKTAPYAGIIRVHSLEENVETKAARKRKVNDSCAMTSKEQMKTGKPKESRSNSRRIIIGSRVLVLSVLVLFNLVYWSYVLTL